MTEREREREGGYIPMQMLLGDDINMGDKWQVRKAIEQMFKRYFRFLK